MKKLITYSIFTELIFLLFAIGLSRSIYQLMYDSIQNSHTQIFNKIDSDLYTLISLDNSPNDIIKYLDLSNSSAKSDDQITYNYGIKLYDSSGKSLTYLYRQDKSLEPKIIDISDKVKNKTLVSKSAYDGLHQCSYEINDSYQTRGYSLYFQSGQEQIRQSILNSMKTPFILLLAVQIGLIVLFLYCSRMRKK